MSPSIVLSLLLGSIYGLLCHAFIGQSWRQLPLYWLGGLAGFFLGYGVAVLGGVETVRLGTVPLLEATLGSCAALGALGWRSRQRGRRVEAGVG